MFSSGCLPSAGHELKILTFPINFLLKSAHFQLRLPSRPFRKPDPGQKCVHWVDTVSLSRWRTRSEERANQAANDRGCMFAPSALGRKGNQLTLAVPVTGVRLVLNHPAPLPAMRILPPSADGLRPPASAPVIRTHCVSVCLARLRLQT